MKILISEGMETTRMLKFGRVAHQVQVYNHKYWSLDILFRFLDFIFWMAILAQKQWFLIYLGLTWSSKSLCLILGMNVYGPVFLMFQKNDVLTYFAKKQTFFLLFIGGGK